MNKMLLTLITLNSLTSFLHASLPPVEAFFQNPTFRSYRISPDGTHIAGLIPYNDFMNVAVINLESKNARVITGQDIDVTNFYWVNNNRILYTVDQGEATNYSQRVAGSIFGVDLDGKNHKPILDSVYERVNTPGAKHRGWISVINILPNDEDHVLVANSSRRSDYPDLFRMNVNSGVLKKVSNNPGYVTSYFVDSDGNVIGGLSWENTEDATTASVMYYNRDTDEWAVAMDVESIYEVPEFLGSMEGDGEQILVSKKSEDGKKRLYRMSFDNGYVSEMILEDEVYDITDITPLYHLKNDNIVGVRFDKEKPVNHFFNSTYQTLYRMLDEAIPNRSNYVFDYDDSGTKLLILSISDKHSPEYFFLDIREGTMDSLGKMFPNLDGIYLPEQKPIKFSASDGHEVHGYLFLPEDYKKGEAVPLIVNPHGGPWARDTWGIRWWLNLEPSFLVSRGFAVLQVNFRASSGYGADHERSADKNWKVAMQDIWDGVQWTIDQGIADPDQIGIMGASFGGTATMLSLVHQPDMFQFGINFFGVVDIPEHIKTYYEWDRDVAGDSWKTRVGNPKSKEDKEHLYWASAINFVDQIDDPLFLYHGLVDRLVDIEQTRLLEKKLKSVGKKKGKDYVITYDTDEGHGAYNAEKRIELYKKIDEFLKPFSPVYQNN
ncbi:MAG: prolyl oligopeptidase family serine peptidase [Opitutales bacterium]|nr:prolyl oligopeptidase family serine peptidase [Opitutales bacterium]